MNSPSIIGETGGYAFFSILVLISTLVLFFSPAFASTIPVADSIPGLSLPAAADTSGRDSLTRALDSLKAWSTTAEVPPFDLESGPGVSGGSWIWVVSSIMIVIGLLYLCLYLLKRFFYRPGGSLGESGQFELLQQFHLGPKKNLTLVRVCGRILLLGVTDSSINTLMEISDEEELRGILAGLNSAPGRKAQNFREIYQGMLGRLKT